MQCAANLEYSCDYFAGQSGAPRTDPASMPWCIGAGRQRRAHFDHTLGKAVWTLVLGPQNENAA
jgi:hypothetical protein